MKKTIISGTYLGRFLYSTLPATLIFLLLWYLVVSFVNHRAVNPYFAVFVSLAYVILYIITDVISITTKKIKLLSIADVIYFNAVAVGPAEIASIERKRIGYRPAFDVIEFGVTAGDVVNFYLVLEKSQRPFKKIVGKSKTLELFFERFPQLQDKLVAK